MKKFLLILPTLCACTGWGTDVVLTEGWRFAKDASGALEAQAPAFDDTAWETVRVPHDWAISGPFDPKASGGTGKLPWQGVGWYRRTFEVAEDGKSVFVDFDGVMARPQVYVNGRLAGGWNYGYMSFRVDATPFVKKGSNTLAVRADTRDHRSRWYPGAGIYRKVTLRVENTAHFAYNSVFIETPRVTRDAATVKVTWETEGAPVGAQVEVAIENVRAAAPAETGALVLTLPKPRLWDVDAPNLYTAAVRLTTKDGAELACERVRFGVRTIAFPTPDDRDDRAANGFHLNGRRVQFKGVDLHSDLGLLGMAFDKSAMRRQLQLMKEMGVNALRTSHNCPAPDLLDLCDEMGILVWNEAFDKWDGTAGRRSDENLERYIGENLAAFVKRDRNHPCVFAWSMANEIGAGKPQDANNAGLTRDRCAFFRNLMRNHDTTRPIGLGNIGYMSNTNELAKGTFDDLDITGWNYGASYRNMKARKPTQALVYTESASAMSSYGYYENPPPRDKHQYPKGGVYQVDSYDHNAGPDIPDIEFDRMEKDAYCCGEFVWTGIDYLGEPSPWWNECRSSFYGIADLCCVPKDRYWLYRSYWRPDVYTLHILPHWNWEGCEGKKVPVYVYTNGDCAELFVNGKSQGLRRKGEATRTRPANKAAGAKVTASSEEVDKHGRANFATCALDGDRETRWCAASQDLPAWLQLDFPQEISFTDVGLSFEQAYENYGFELYLSDDGATWRNVFAKRVGERKYVTFERPVRAKAMKIVVTGSRSKGWASIRDVIVADEPYDAGTAYYDVCDKYRLRWHDVVYEPGELKAVAYKDGKKIGEETMCTAGAPAALVAAVEKPLGKDPGELLWVQVDALDAKGVRHPRATNRVNFKLEGPGQIVGVGNGNPYAFEAFTKTDSHPLFFGKGVAVVRRTGAGRLALTVSSDGLAPATVELP